VILQGGEPAVRMAIAGVLPGMVDGLHGSMVPPPLDEFAAAMAATDMVISVDTMGAHLAGAMAHPGVVMLPTAPSFCGMFWGHAGDRYPWYPSLRFDPAVMLPGLDGADPGGPGNIGNRSSNELPGPLSYGQSKAPPDACPDGRVHPHTRTFDGVKHFRAMEREAEQFSSCQ
jgi:hypothetical protein